MCVVRLQLQLILNRTQWPEGLLPQDGPHKSRKSNMLAQALHGAARMLKRDGSIVHRDKGVDESGKSLNEWSAKGLHTPTALGSSAIPEERSSRSLNAARELFRRACVMSAVLVSHASGAMEAPG
jgi:hypothetical protein